MVVSEKVVICTSFTHRINNSLSGGSGVVISGSFYYEYYSELKPKNNGNDGKSRVCTSFRTHLPVKPPKCDSSIWSVLKTCIGKDLSKITMPVQFNEPLSFLQRISEHMEYSELLQIDTDDPVERIQVNKALY